MSKIAVFIVNVYRSVKQYIISYFKVPSKIEKVQKELEEIRVLIGNMDRNILELKEIDFIAVGK